jgi:hypothetical protein
MRDAGDVVFHPRQKSVSAGIMKSIERLKKTKR